jgi:hypothetical protein
VSSGAWALACLGRLDTPDPISLGPGEYKYEGEQKELLRLASLMLYIILKLRIHQTSKYPFFD